MAAITPHFSLEELTITQQTGPDGKVLPNEPNAEQLKYLTKLATLALEPIRTMWSCPVRVNSAFRCEAVEIKVSGKAYGQHMLGQAADIVPVGSIPLKAAYELIMNSKVPYDQLLLENAGTSRWIHISIAPDSRAPRRQALMTPDAKNWLVYNGNKVSLIGKVSA